MKTLAQKQLEDKFLKGFNQEQTQDFMKELNVIHGRLIGWFSEKKRDLPWRVNYLPYEVWVSEVMLQQTRVETVISYFQNWMRRFPTIQSLVLAKEDQILKAWEGLGYYSRVKNLYKGAKKVLKEHEGKLPESKSELLKIAGIGPYTAGAISSIAFQNIASIVDGNVERVFSRLFLWKEEIKLRKSRIFFESQSLKLAQLGDPRNINQAIMELGAMVCRPKNPDCKLCPVQNQCEAFRTNQVSLLPIKAKKQNTIKTNMVLLVLENEGKYYLEKQEEGQKWSGMWSFPFAEMSNHEDSPDQYVHQFLWDQYALTSELVALTSFKHSVTRYRIHARPYFGKLFQRYSGKGSWFSLSHLAELSLPKSGVQIRIQLQISSLQGRSTDCWF